MRFSELAEYYEKLEATSKRLELVDILSKLFKEAKAEEIGKICYLIQGRVAPFFEPVEIGMAESMVAQSIGRAFNKSKDEVIKLYRHKGNMGIAAAQLSTNAKRLTTKALSVTEVFEELAKIAKFSGKGTVEQKVSTLAQVLKSLDSTSVKHVVNIPLGTLRLGIGDPTVLDALSIAKTGDKKLRPMLEGAYNKTSDLGYVAENFFRGTMYISKTEGKFWATIKVVGSGKKGQLDATVHGLARALNEVNKKEFRPILKKAGFLTRDSRVKERRKYGRAQKARKGKQSPKR